jgi:hypothetical protein
MWRQETRYSELRTIRAASGEPIGASDRKFARNPSRSDHIRTTALSAALATIIAGEAGNRVPWRRPCPRRAFCYAILILLIRASSVVLLAILP